MTEILQQIINIAGVALIVAGVAILLRVAWKIVTDKDKF